MPAAWKRSGVRSLRSRERLARSCLLPLDTLDSRLFAGSQQQTVAGNEISSRDEPLPAHHIERVNRGTDQLPVWVRAVVP